ncbi:traB domain-containing protein-like [Ylistrum balloti]|uniref:traB domain-containing protein-like n=1 Tax=Ylistrum balloti TaxID=509963 RepID=UPI002905CAFB|nr:traB domain-containing protein-like [Ylistrum balloti]
MDGDIIETMSNGAHGPAAHGDASSKPSKEKDKTEASDAEVSRKILKQEPAFMDSEASEFEDGEDEEDDSEEDDTEEDDSEEDDTEEDYTGNDDDEDTIEIENNDEVEVQRASRDPNPELPNTVTVLANNSEMRVFLVGTAHFSKESREDVAETIRKTQPDIVILELCESRTNMLHFDEKFLLEETKNFNLQKIKQTINKMGFIQGIAFILALRISAHIARELGMASGLEFHEAMKEARRSPICKVVASGDRPIEITMKRVLAYLSVWQKFQLALLLLFGLNMKVSKEDIEKYKNRDLLQQVLQDMSAKIPALVRVVVEERDTCLAYSLKNGATLFKRQMRANGSETDPVDPVVVVGVVGIGHVSGIIANWEEYRYDIKEILSIPNQQMSLLRRTFGWAFKISLAGAVGIGCYKLSRLIIDSLL